MQLRHEFFVATVLLALLGSTPADAGIIRDMVRNPGE